jgi:polygalacturonase
MIIQINSTKKRNLTGKINNVIHMAFSNIRPVVTLFLLFLLQTGALFAQPDWITDVGAKSFPPDKKIIKVNDYNPFKDQLIASTRAIQDAIDACSSQGGGTVVFEPGVYHTGAIFLKDNVNLLIGHGVELRALMGLEYYPEIETRVAGIVMKWPCGIINILDKKNVAVTGTGTIHAQGKIYWERYWNLRHEYTPKGLRWASDYDCKRVRAIQVLNSTDVSLRDFTVKQSGFWTVHLLFSKRITVDGLTIRNNIDGFGPSTDGINVDSSTLIEIMNCDVDGNDDNYCIKAGRDADGLRINKPAEYVYIHNCTARRGGGTLVIGSETSGWIRHVFVEDMKAIGSSYVVYLKSAKTRGGGIEDIEVRNIHATRTRSFCGATVNWNPEYSYTSLQGTFDSIPEHWKIMLKEVPEEQGIPHIRNVRISNCTADSIRYAGFDIQGIEKSIIESFSFKNIKLTASEAGIINWASDIVFDEVKIFTPDKKGLIVKNSKNISTNKIEINKNLP